MPSRTSIASAAPYRGPSFAWSVALAFAAIVGCADTAATPSPESVLPAASRLAAQQALPPSTYWRARTDRLEDVACRRQLDAVRARVIAGPTTSLLAVRGDQIVFSLGPIARPSQIRSARKSLLAMLFGKPVQEGRIDLDATLEQLGIDDIDGLLPIERLARVRDLLTARSGVYHAAANGGDDAAAAPPRGSQIPGTYFLYNNWDFNAAGDVFEQQTRRGIYDAFAEDIGTPLGLEDFHRERHHRGGDATRSSHLAYSFYLSARDMARIGELMLANGRWQGRQLVQANWLRTITTPVTRAADMHSPHVAHHHIDYGYLWWIPEEPADSSLAGSYLAWGYFGQYLLVVPQRGMVVVHKYDTNPSLGGPPIPTLRVADLLAIARDLVDAPCP